MEPQQALTAALLTPAGRGAVATIRVLGIRESLDFGGLFRAANGRPVDRQPIGRIVFGAWGLRPAEGEDVVICRVDQHALEIHCHGGDVAAARILSDLERGGCQIVTWRHQQTSMSGFLQAEIEQLLSRASTWRAAEILNEQASGLFQSAVQQIVCGIAEDASTSGLIAHLEELLTWSSFGIHLTEPWAVVLTGLPNVGKSSLINALVGYQRAIVFDQPGTTRDVLTAETALDGWPIQFADTAGLRDTTEALEAAGIALARNHLQRADVLLLLVDLSVRPTREDWQLIADRPEAILVGHKCDLHDQWQDQLPANALRVSSKTADGLQRLQQRLVECLVPRVPAPGTAIPTSIRQVSLLEAARSSLLSGQRDAARLSLETLIRGSESDQTETRSSSVPSGSNRNAGPAS